jgi:hypothetical protein
MNDEQIISDMLRRHGDRIRTGTGDLGGVHRRGRALARRRRVATQGALGISAVGLVAGSVAVLARSPQRQLVSTSEPAESIPVAAPPSDGTDAAPAAAVVDDNLVWNPVTPDSAEAVAFGGLVGDAGTGPFFRFSTAPGKTDTYTPQLYRSADGVRWETVTNPPVNQRGLAAYDNQVFALGTGPARGPIPDGGTGDVALAASSDAGDSWNSVALPVDLRRIGDLAGVARVDTFGGGIAATDEGVVAMIDLDITFDVVVDGTLSSRHPDAGVIKATPTGLDVYGGGGGGLCDGGKPLPTASTTVPAPTTTITCVPRSEPPDTGPNGDGGLIQSYTWDELGIDPEAGTLVDRGPLVFHSTDGATFQQVEVPFSGPSFWDYDSQLTAFGGGYLISGNPYDTGGDNRTTQMYVSADGVTWQAVASPPGADRVGLLPDGRLLAYGSLAGTAAVSTDGLSWSVHQLPAELASGGAVAFGPLGVVMVPYGEGNQPLPVLRSLDGVTWRRSTLEPVGLSGVAQNDNAVLITATGRNTDPDEPALTEVWVGTPAS